MVSRSVKLPRIIRFGEDFELDLHSYKLRRGEHVLRLERIPTQILFLLIEQRPEVVTRQEIVERVWGKGVFLDTDNSINGAIRKIRHVLHDDSEQPRFVQTISGRGYRFIAEVSDMENGNQAPSPVETQLLTRSPGQLVLPQPQSTKFRFWLRLALVLGVLLVSAAGIFRFVFTHRRPLPFEVVKTVRITSSGRSGKAAISPDGAYIAHTLVSSGRESLRLRRANMLSDVELVPPVPGRYLGLSFSLDGQTLYYVFAKTGDESGTLYRIALIGGTPQKIKDYLDSPITFSPDGKKYAFVRESATTSTLIISDFDNGGDKPVISRKLPEVVDYPAWSPDGRVIVFTDTDASVASPRGSNARLMQVRVADGNEKLLSPQTWGFVRELAWLHDQSGLVMSARSPEESGFFHIWYVSYPDGASRQITEGVYRQRGVSISLDASQMVTVQESAFSSIWRLPSLRDAAPELVVSGESGTSAPIWITADRIVFEEELDGRRSIFSVNVDGTNRKELTLTGNNYDASVSETGRTLVFISDRSGTPAIWTMDLENGNTQLLTKAMGEPVPQLSPDGKWVVFTAIGAAHWITLWKMPVSGGQAVELNDRFWSRPVISPDGNWIAGLYADGQLNTQTIPTSIAIISSSGASMKNVFHLPVSMFVPGGIRWSRDGRELCYISSGQEGANVWAQPVNGGAPHQITFFKGIDLFSFDWSADGKQLVFSRGFQARDVVMVKDARRY